LYNKEYNVKKRGNVLQHLSVLARAKINIVLDVVGLRPDGYHEVSMVMQSVTLADMLHFEQTDAGISVTSTNPLLPTGPDNLAYRAADLLIKASGIHRGVHIHIDKKIPVAAGLGGGSADAAGVLSGLNSLWNLGIGIQDLQEIGLELGADVPFCLVGGTSWARGIGEHLTPLKPPLKPIHLVLVKLPICVSTARIYKYWDNIPNTLHPDVKGIIELIRYGDWGGIPQLWGNTLEMVTFKLHPEVRDLYEDLKTEYSFVRMSGSGPTLFAWDFASEKAAADFALEHNRAGILAMAVKTCDQGILLIEGDGDTHGTKTFGPD
jgi:4-diphosphocytidyl-2-C-methyl-D-erythritol kinase